MLAMTRFEGESVYVETPGGVIEVKVTRISGSKVGLAIDAPKCYPIRRAELPPLAPAPRQDAA